MATQWFGTLDNDIHFMYECEKCRQVCEKECLPYTETITEPEPADGVPFCLKHGEHLTFCGVGIKPT